MSELKAYGIRVIDGLVVESESGQLYLKSEADKVIAELKQKINEAQTELELWRDGSIISETHQKELDEKRHSDYKRCLAMAKWCLFWANYWHCCEPTDLGAFIARERFFRKWNKR